MPKFIELMTAENWNKKCIYVYYESPWD